MKCIICQREFSAANYSGTVSEKFLGNISCPYCGAWNDVPRRKESSKKEEEKD